MIGEDTDENGVMGLIGPRELWLGIIIEVLLPDGLAITGDLAPLVVEGLLPGELGPPGELPPLDDEGLLPRDVAS